MAVPTPGEAMTESEIVIGEGYVSDAGFGGGGTYWGDDAKAPLEVWRYFYRNAGDADLLTMRESAEALGMLDEHGEFRSSDFKFADYGKRDGEVIEFDGVAGEDYRRFLDDFTRLGIAMRLTVQAMAALDLR